MGLFFNFSQGCSGQETPAKIDRKPAVAGRFYPADARELKDTLASLFSRAKPLSSTGVIGIVCPHAGYVFSGIVAASGYNQADADKQYDNVFVIASSHRLSFPGASVYTPGDYITPLGKVKVNTELAKQLIIENSIFTYNPDADLTEHSLEVQLPFLQYHLKKEFKLVPVILGTQSEETCRQIANALKPWFNDHNLFVFSTDFSHYPSYHDAQNADKATCEAITSGDPDKLISLIRDYKGKKIPNLVTNLCGWTSVLVMLNLIDSEPGIEITPIAYMNSGDTKSGDKNEVVGYWSLVVTSHPVAFEFTKEEKLRMLQIARTTIEQYLHVNTTREYDASLFDQNLRMHAGVFVTLREDGKLRGCIGRFTADTPLYKLIGQMAVASATEDSRFNPVQADEISRLNIEISVLSPLKKINSTGEIIIGRHGIYIKKGFRSGTFLPHVATENGWTVVELLGHCARDKAGLGWDGWKDAELFIYEADVFSEGEITGGRD